MRRPYSALTAFAATLLLTASAARAQTASFQWTDFSDLWAGTKSHVYGVSDPLVLPGGTTTDLVGGLGFEVYGYGFFCEAEAASQAECPAGSYISMGSTNAVSPDGKANVGFLISNLGNIAFRWKPQANQFERLGFLPGGDDGFLHEGRSQANGVSASGDLVVGSSDSKAGVQAFRWSGGKMHGLGFLPLAKFSNANAVSGNGKAIVGSSGNCNKAPCIVEAFRWTAAEGMVGLGFLPGGTSSAANAVNRDGSIVVGVGTDSAGRSQATVWTDGAPTGLGFLADGTYSEANAVNTRGTVIVGHANTSAGVQAVRWRNGVVKPIAELLHAQGIEIAGTLTMAYAVSTDGTVIAGEGIGPGGLVQGWVATLP